jgi:hypothetical protein
MVVTSNQVVGSSNLSGRAPNSKLDHAVSTLSDSMGPRRPVTETVAGKTSCQRASSDRSCKYPADLTFMQKSRNVGDHCDGPLLRLLLVNATQTPGCKITYP